MFLTIFIGWSDMEWPMFTCVYVCLYVCFVYMYTSGTWRDRFLYLLKGRGMCLLIVLMCCLPVGGNDTQKRTSKGLGGDSQEMNGGCCTSMVIVIDDSSPCLPRSHDYMFPWLTHPVTTIIIWGWGATMLSMLTSLLHAWCNGIEVLPCYQCPPPSWCNGVEIITMPTSLMM